MAIELVDGDILLYTLRCLYQQQTVLNTWHFKVTQFTPEPIDYEDAANAILQELEQPGDFIDQLEAITVTGYSFIDHRIQRVYPTRNRQVIQTLSTTGSVATTGSQVNQAAVITKYGNVAGRFAIGSWHQAGLPTAAFSSFGRVEEVTQSALKAAVDMLTVVGDIEGFAGTVANPVLWSPTVPTRVTPIVETVPQFTSRVMRRRTVGLGI